MISMVNDEVLRKWGWNSGLILRHEIGHCNGWAGDHPGIRAISWPTPYIRSTPQQISASTASTA